MGYSDGYIENANTAAEQATFSAAGQTYAIGMADQVVSPFVEGSLEDTLDSKLGLEENSPSGDPLSSHISTWK